MNTEFAECDTDDLRKFDEDEAYVPPSRRKDAPLAGIVSPDIEGIDPRRFFPDFKPNAILRFSRVFASNSKPTIRNQIWWTSRTFKKANFSAKSLNSVAPSAALADETRSVVTETSIDEKKPVIGTDASTNEICCNGLKKINNDITSANKDYGGFAIRLGKLPTADDCVTDEREIYSSYNDPSFWLSTDKNSSQASDEEEDAIAWRFGPAQIWYDRMNVPVNPRRFDYGFGVKKNSSRKLGFKTRKDASAKTGFSSPTKNKQQQNQLATVTTADSTTTTTTLTKKSSFENPFLPVNLLHWEDNVIIDSEEAKNRIVSDFKDGKLPRCGWIPTAQTRSYQTFMNAWNQGIFLRMFTQSGGFQKPLDSGNVKATVGSTHSIFPMDNYDLEMTNWEDDIIWDSDNMQKIPEPKILTVDYEDDPRLFYMHDETSTNEEKEATRQLFKKDQHTKKSEIILLQVQQRQRQEEEEQMECTIAQIADKDPFNLSNDDYYCPKNTGKTTTVSTNAFSNIVHHSIPAQNICRTFFPTNLTPQNPTKLRQFHRQPISKALSRDVIDRWTTVYSLARHIRIANEERQKQKLSEGGADLFIMRETHDLTGRDGCLVLLEYSEENPSFLNQPGMASKIRNYYKRKFNKEVEEELEFGETAFTHTSPFLGNLAPGQCLQAVENNMYRAPIYRHSTRFTDFLLIRTKLGFFIRKCPPLFLAGQECPMYEVPPPNSKQSSIFVRDFLMAFIYRQFWESDETPRRLRMEEIRAAFPHTAECSVRKRLKQCADFRRFADQNYWVLREDFRLPRKEEVLSMVTPEMCCAQWSMYAAEQRLRDAGFGDKYFFTPENEDSSDDEVTMEDEIKCAPWNTTKAYIASIKGKCLLDQTGIADPTGCGQGFSYVRVSSKPPKEEVPQVPKRVVTGTNADLRKLPLKEAKEICREYGLRDDELNSLSRWDIIHVIRTLSTQAAKAKSDFKGMARFARGNIRMNFADIQEKYKEHCQKIFDLQNRALSNQNEMSTDECSTGDDSENDGSIRRLQRVLSGSKQKKALSYSSSTTLTEAEKRKLEYEMEERERLDLQRMIRGEVTKNGGAMVSKGAKDAVAHCHDDFSKDDSKEGFSIIDPNTSSDQGFLLQDAATKKLKIYRTFKSADGNEWTRVEVISHPQLIEAYVRIRSTKSEDFIKVFAQNDGQFKEERRKEKRRLQDQLRRLRRNEAKAEQMGPEVSTKKKSEKEKKPPPPPKPSLLKMRCSACGGVGHMKTNKYCPLYGQRQKNPETTQTVGDICPTSTYNETDMTGGVVAVEGTRLKISKKWYNQAEKAQKDSLRLHIPKHYFEKEKKIVEEVDQVENKPSKKQLTNYVKRETSIETDKSGQHSASFHPPISLSSAGTAPISRRRGTVEEADYLMGPQKSVHRRRADPRVSMATVLHEIFSELKAIDHAEHLMFPVNAKKVPDYYTIISRPMDLQQIRQNISLNKYELRRQFLEDLTQILVNTHTYNGAEHVITKAARKILDLASKRLEENEQKLIELEKAINPLLDDDDMVGFSHILKEIVQECKNLPKSAAFHAKVDAKKFPLYNEKVKRPMDLSKIEQNIKEHRYTSVEAFQRDLKQIYVNSQIYNGINSSYTEKAAEIVQMAERLIDTHRANLTELESNIQRSLNAPADDALSRMTDDTQSRTGEDTMGEAFDFTIHDEGANRYNADADASLSAGGPRFTLGADDDFSRQTASIMPDEMGWRATNFANTEIATDEEETRSETGGGVLQDDLALSNDEYSDDDDLDNEDDDEAIEDNAAWSNRPEADLFQSQMHTSGQLNADLALSDSDDSDEELISAKRPKLDDLEGSL